MSFSAAFLYFELGRFTVVCCCQDFFKAVYADPKVLEKYHRETTGDESATVTPWRDSEDGLRQQRTVKYQVPLAVPVAIKRLIGKALPETCAIGPA